MKRQHSLINGPEMPPPNFHSLLRSVWGQITNISGYTVYIKSRLPWLLYHTVVTKLHADKLKRQLLEPQCGIETDCIKQPYDVDQPQGSPYTHMMELLRFDKLGDYL